MCFSTIYGRYHYIADIFGGITTATIGYFVGAWIMRKSEERVGAQEQQVVAASEV
jgi:membrane-associated phospholipid phosphatase